MVCRIGGAKSKETRYMQYDKVTQRFDRILQLTVLNLQMRSLFANVGLL